MRVNDATFQRLMRLKIDDGFEDKTWTEWLDHVSRKVDLYPTDGKTINRGTSGLMPLWMKNFADNIPRIRDGKNIRELVSPGIAVPPNHRIIVVGRGPSIFKKKHLELLAKSGYKGDVITTDGMLIECLKNGVVPTYVASLDGNPICKKWFDDPIVDEHAPKIKALLCSQVNIETYQRAKQAGLDIYWFNPNYDDVEVRDSLTKMQLYMTMSPKNPGGSLGVECKGNVGSFSVIFCWSALKKMDVCLIGMDMGYPVDMPLEETYYYSKALDYLGVLEANTNYEKVYHPVFKTESRIDPVFKQYRATLLDAFYKKPKWARICNCSEGGTIFHQNVECIKFEEWLKQ